MQYNDTHIEMFEVFNFNEKLQVIFLENFVLKIHFHNLQQYF
jgi:hypothetical protein